MSTFKAHFGNRCVKIIPPASWMYQVDTPHPPRSPLPLRPPDPCLFFPTKLTSLYFMSVEGLMTCWYHCTLIPAPFLWQVLLRDDNIQKLNAEMGKLRAKHQEKLHEVSSVHSGLIPDVDCQCSSHTAWFLYTHLLFSCRCVVYAFNHETGRLGGGGGGGRGIVNKCYAFQSEQPLTRPVRLACCARVHLTVKL